MRWQQVFLHEIRVIHYGHVGDIVSEKGMPSCPRGVALPVVPFLHVTDDRFDVVIIRS